VLLFLLTIYHTDNTNSELLHLEDVTVVTGLRPQNGAEDQTAPELSAMLAVYVSTRR
jgi:hypothetical protein